jgi:CRISPR type IV-associated protein Csf2
MTSRILLTGSVTTLSPLHIAGFDEAQPHLATGHWQAGETERGAKVTAIQRLPVMRFVADDEVDAGAAVVADADVAVADEAAAGTDGPLAWTDRTRVEIPVIHATTLRGALRRAAADVVKDALIARDETLSLSCYHALQSGAPNATGNSGEGVDVALTHEAAAHPFVGLFGGGARLFRSHLVCTTAVPPFDHPVVQAMLPAGTGLLPLRARTADGHEYAVNPRDVVKRQWFIRRDDALALDDPRATTVVADFDGDVEKYAAAVAANETRDLRLKAAVEVVVPGTPFGWSLELPDTTPAQLGLVLLALQNFARAQRLGGLNRHGFGRFALQLTLTSDNGKQVPVFLDAVGQAAPYALNAQAPVICEALAAWTADAATLDAATLERLLTPNAEAPKRGRKAKAKASA